MSSMEVCNIIEKGIQNIFPDTEVIKIPIADGGEGTVDAFLTAIGGEKIKTKVKGPLFEEVEAFYGILPDKETAVIEMAAASGLTLAEDKKNPLLTTTYGTGQLILDALNRGCSKIIVGIGGSATNDGGIGMAAALGVKFLDEENKAIDLTGGGLEKLERIDISDIDDRVKECTIVAACDVDNPLFGPSGAAYVFAPQKGADEGIVKILDENLKNFATMVRRDLDVDVQNISGSGAAGGLGAGLVAFAGAKLQPIPFEHAKVCCRENLLKTTESVMRLIKGTKNIK